MRVGICDDDEQIHNTIKKLLQENATTACEHLITDFYCGEDLIESYNQDAKFDLLFLDVEMNQINGVQTAKTIRQFDRCVILVFISSYKQYVFDAFSVEALHYIMKPINPDEFREIYQRSVIKYQDLHTSITLKWMYERYTLQVHEIMYIEGYQRHVIVHTIHEKYEAVGKVSDFADTLIPNGFVQVHHSYIVNMDYIKSIQKDRVILQNDENVWMSVRKRTDTLKAFDNYLGNRKW